MTKFCHESSLKLFDKEKRSMKNIYTLVLIAIMSAGLLVIGCGPTPATPEDMEGTWATECFTLPIFEVDYLADYTVEYTLNERTTTLTFYYEPLGCGGYPLWDLVTTSSYTLGDIITNGSGEDVTALDAIVISQTETILDPGSGTTDGFNGGATCGWTDWAYGITRDITGNANCPGPPPSAGNTLSQVLQLVDEETYIAGADAEYNGPRVDELGDLTYTKL
jgi:hypothetical protein